MKKVILAIFTSLTILFSGCQSDEPGTGENGGATNPEGSERPVTFTIRSRAIDNEELAQNQQPTQENELMHNWRVLFVKDGKVKYIVDSDPTKFTEGVGKAEDTYTVKVMPGKYTIYAFANTESLNNSIVTSQGNASISGTQVEGLTKFFTDATNPIVTEEENKWLPMSREMEVTISKENNESKNTFTIWLVRLVAKVEFEFSTENEAGYSISGVTFGSLYSDEVPLFPTVDGDNKVVAPPSVPENAVAKTGVYDFTRFSLKKNDKPVYKHFYIRETSAAKHPTGHFYLSVKLAGENGVLKEQRYALTGKIADAGVLTQILRNDYIQIPIKISDYRIELAVNFYPPIGGYPAVVNRDKEKEEFYVDFMTIGNFRIIPSVYKNNVLVAENVTVTVENISDTTPILKGADKDSKLRNEAGELLGGFVEGKTDGTPAPLGTAAVTLKIEIEESPDVTRVFTPTVYINRIQKQQ